MNQRIEGLRKLLVSQGLGTILITTQENRQYLSGFTGTTAVLVIGPTRAMILTDFRYLEQAAAQCPGFQVVKVEKTLIQTVAEVTAGLQVDELACEEEHITYHMYRQLQDALGSCRLVPVGGLVEKVRMVKDQTEIASIRQAVAIADRAWAELQQKIRPGVSEQEISLELEFMMRRQGASKLAFDSIVASGWRSAMPHGVASERKLQVGDLLTMDFGAVYQGYHSDITRTVVLGQPSDKQQEIYQIVLAAQLAGVAAVKPGVKASSADRAARDVIESYGYGANFGHGTGHGLGLEIHEQPRLSTRDDTILEPGMVVTVEPGIYLPGWGGVRIEDSVLVTEQGCEVLTQAPKDRLVSL